MARRAQGDPEGDIESFPLRAHSPATAAFLHSGRSIVRFHGHNCWITCGPDVQRPWNEQWRPRGFTWLYFYDEALSFAAGHRPCAECGWRDYSTYRRAWGDSIGGGGAPLRRRDEPPVARGAAASGHPPAPDARAGLVGPAGRHVRAPRAGAARRRGRPPPATGPGRATGTPPRPTVARRPSSLRPARSALLAAGYPVQIDGSATA